MPQSSSPPADPITYHVDADDHITWLSPEWSLFAAANDAAELVDVQTILGQVIWRYIDGLTERTLYQQFFDRVRADGRPIRVPLRCDSPTLCRRLELQISRLSAGGGLLIRSHVLRTDPRPAVKLLDRRTPRSMQVVDICSFCLKIRSGNDWLEAEQAVQTMRLFSESPAPNLSHGVCPDCLPELHRRLGMGPDRSDSAEPTSR